MEEDNVYYANKALDEFKTKFSTEEDRQCDIEIVFNEAENDYENDMLLSNDEKYFLSRDGIVFKNELHPESLKEKKLKILPHGVPNKTPLTSKKVKIYHLKSENERGNKTAIQYYYGEYLNGEKRNNGHSISTTARTDDDIGETIFRNIIEYKGEFSHNLPDGTGVKQDAYGIYTGEFKNGKKYGFGVEEERRYIQSRQIIRENKYEGEFKDDLPDGIGVLKTKNYDPYTDKDSAPITKNGKFVKGNFTGFGALKKRNGEIYEGIWCKGKPVGSIIKTSPKKTHKYLEEYQNGILRNTRELTNLEKKQDQYKSHFDI